MLGNTSKSCRIFFFFFSLPRLSFSFSERYLEKEGSGHAGSVKQETLMKEGCDFILKMPETIYNGKISHFEVNNR
jgi:hypothetical protein